MQMFEQNWSKRLENIRVAEGVTAEAVTCEFCSIMLNSAWFVYLCISCHSFNELQSYCQIWMAKS